jgi:hypothetical protein
MDVRKVGVAAIGIKALQIRQEVATDGGVYNGMFPCFFGGFLSRLFRSIANVVMSFGRVDRGSMISSMYPRSAAM